MFIIFILKIKISAGPQRRQQITGLLGAGEGFKYF
jgi:hypothetical protein